MKRGIIENDSLSALESREQNALEPGLNHPAIAVTGKGHGSKNLAHTPSSNHRHAFGKVTKLSSPATRTFETPAIGVVERILHPCFVNVNALFRA